MRKLITFGGVCVVGVTHYYLFGEVVKEQWDKYSNKRVLEEDKKYQEKTEENGGRD